MKLTACMVKYGTLNTIDQRIWARLDHRGTSMIWGRVGAPVHRRIREQVGMPVQNQLLRGGPR